MDSGKTEAFCNRCMVNKFNIKTKQLLVEGRRQVGQLSKKKNLCNTRVIYINVYLFTTKKSMNINNKNSDTNMGKEKCLYYVAELLKELNHFHNTKLINNT